MSSWLTGLAGKAENLLNNLDSSAGEALQRGKDESYEDMPASVVVQQDRNFYPEPEPQSIGPPITYSPSKSPMQMSTPPVSRSQSQASSVSGNGSTKKFLNPSDKDAELMQFLNSDVPALSASSVSSVKRAASQTQSQTHSRASSITSGFSKVSVSEVAEAAAATASTIPKVAPASLHDRGSPPSKNSPDVGSESTEDAPSGPAALELENKLLRSEVSSLSQEVSALLRRNQAGAEKQKMGSDEINRLREHLSAIEDQLRSARSAESDLIEQLQVKDSQAAALRMEVQEARLFSENLKTQMSDMHHDQKGMSDVSQHALEELRVKALRAEEALARELNSTRSLQEELQRMKASLEEARVRLSEATADQHRALAEEKRKSESVNMEVENLRRRSEQAQTELREYKDKAAKILAMKERMIATLKGGSGKTDGLSGDADASDVSQLQAELESVRHERELLREEVQRAKWNAETMQCDMQELEMQAQSESETFRRNMAALERQLETERGARSAAEEELAVVRRESGFVAERATREKTEMSTRLAEKEAEIERLRRQVTLKSQNGGQEQQELENRVRSLTENLIQKQTTIEAVGAERNSLRLKVEHLERQLTERHQIQALVGGSSSGVDDMNVTRDRHPYINPQTHRRGSNDYMKINMADPPIAKNVKRAVNSLDAAGVRFGVFLRRYPPARLFFLVYIMILHLWVAVVLLTYQPEMHTDWHAPGAKPVPPRAPAVSIGASKLPQASGT